MKKIKKVAENDKRLINELRICLNLPDTMATDAEILKHTDGTLTRARVEFYLALCDLRMAAIQCFPLNLIKWLAEFLEERYGKDK